MEGEREVASMSALLLLLLERAGLEPAAAALLKITYTLTDRRYCDSM
jgi:hypothetical protein